MSANADKKDSAYERQLAELETSLRRHENDESMLGEVGLAIRNLLAGNGESEAHIRQLLEREHDEGRLRPETYELVERLLAKIVAEQPADAADVASAGRAVDTVDFDPTVTDAVETAPPAAGIKPANVAADSNSLAIFSKNDRSSSSDSRSETSMSNKPSGLPT